MEKTFNLVTDPWIKVFDGTTNKEKTVSLIDLFKNSQDYLDLVGDIKSQDVSIMRLLLAILTTVYSRFDAGSEPYEWLEIDEDTLKVTDIPDDYDEDVEDDLLETWRNLFEQGHFSDQLYLYLEKYQDKFDFFGEHPFYQVTKEQYDSFVPKNKHVDTGTGTVNVMQINRTISQSNNSPAIFSPKSDQEKNQLTIDELVRWIITYQNIAATTDKTKVVLTESKEKLSNSPGWLYGFDAVYAQGKNLFETLMLNLILVPKDGEKYQDQHPIWEFDNVEDYVRQRTKALVPDNIAELYTDWARCLHIEWDDGTPTIFTAGLPKVDMTTAFEEPMAIWRSNDKEETFRPLKKTQLTASDAIWRNFELFIPSPESQKYHVPGIVSWLNKLKDKEYVAGGKIIDLAMTTMISDGNATSQSPAREVSDNLKVRANVLFDPDPQKADWWPVQISEVVAKTQEVGKTYWSFLAMIAELKGYGSSDAKEFASHYLKIFYQHVNIPFRQWLISLTNDDERSVRVSEWYENLKKIALEEVDERFNESSSREISGIKRTTSKKEDAEAELFNIFIAKNIFEAKLRKLNL